MPEARSTNVSALTLALPLVASRPPEPSEFRQPAPPPTALLLPHGQGVPVPSPKQYAKVVGPPPGTWAAADIEPGVPLFHKPNTTSPLAGATSASKRKLYVELQRIAFALAFCACVCVDHVSTPPTS